LLTDDGGKNRNFLSGKMFEEESISEMPSQRPSPKLENKEKDESGEINRASEATQPAEAASPILVTEDLIK
jgi:hypothetical protein